MPDPLEMKLETREARHRNRIARDILRLQNHVGDLLPDRDVVIVGFSITLQDVGWLLVIRGVDGIRHVVMFRHMMRLEDWAGVALEALRDPRWLPDRFRP
jgi:hypothetical protein